MSAPASTDTTCRICGGPMLACDAVTGFGQHLVDLSEPDGPDVTSQRDPTRQMIARQRRACSTGRAAAIAARPPEPGVWLATGTPMEQPYPCRCAEFDEWQHSHGRCACTGRQDVHLVPTGCCAYVPPSPEPEPEPPASTVAQLRDVLIDYELSRPRSQQVRLGPSELGTPCLAQVIRKLAGLPQRELTAPAWAPFIGTAVHSEMERVIAHWNAAIGRARWVAEDELACGDDITGHGDAYDNDTGTVVDWKVVGVTALNKLRQAQRKALAPAEQISVDYRVQAHLYGAGHAAKGRDVRWVRVVMLARSWRYDDAAEWTERYNPAIAAAAIERYVQAKGLVAALRLDAQPDLIATVPLTPHACNWCPFHRPGAANDAQGCPGDVVRVSASMDRFTDGLVSVTTAQTTDVL